MTRFGARLTRQFVPSRTMAAYLARQFVIRFAMMLVLIVAILQLLDLMAQSDAILEPEGATRAALASYVALRAPQLIDQFIPFAALLGILFTLVGLRQTSELTVMRGAGLSPHRLLFPLGLVCLVIALGHFWLGEAVVVDASDRLKYWQQQDYAVDLPPRSGYRGDIWLTEGERIIHVGSLSRSGSRVVLDEVSVYGLNDAGMLTRTERADFAWYDNGRWTRFGLRRYGVDDMAVTGEQAAPWDLSLTPEQFLTRSVDPETTDLSDLQGAARSLAQQGRDNAALRTSVLARFSGPAATLVMPLLGAVAGFGGSRRGRGTARLLIGMALGFSYFVAENFMLAMGELGSVPPLIAAFAPFVFFTLIGFAVVFLLEE